jgi:hypothetical protein
MQSRVFSHKSVPSMSSSLPVMKLDSSPAGHAFGFARMLDAAEIRADLRKPPRGGGVAWKSYPVMARAGTASG